MPRICVPFGNFIHVSKRKLRATRVASLEGCDTVLLLCMTEKIQLRKICRREKEEMAGGRIE